MPGNTLSKGEVFVIDTDAASREQLSNALQQSAYDVICFADGASLLSEAKTRMPDVFESASATLMLYSAIALRTPSGVTQAIFMGR